MILGEQPLYSWGNSPIFLGGKPPYYWGNSCAACDCVSSQARWPSVTDIDVLLWKRARGRREFTKPSRVRVETIHSRDNRCLSASFARFSSCSLSSLSSTSSNSSNTDGESLPVPDVEGVAVSGRCFELGVRGRSCALSGRMLIASPSRSYANSRPKFSKSPNDGCVMHACQRLLPRQRGAGACSPSTSFLPQTNPPKEPERRPPD